MKGDHGEMNKKAKRNFTLISLVIGFLIAVQFQTVQQPAGRDTRDIWDIRQELLAQLEQQSVLLSQIQVQDKTIRQYDDDKEASNEQALMETVQALEKESGLTSMEGPGITIALEPVMEELLMGGLSGEITPDLLKRLVNQLYHFDAKYIAVDGQRLITTSVIRDINGNTTVNRLPLADLPVEIHVVTKNWQDAEKIYNRMQGSALIEEFFIDDIRLTVNNPVRNLTIPAYEDTIHVRSMEPVSIEEGE